MPRDPIQIPQLVDPHPQRHPYRRISFGRPAREMIDQKVELPAIPQAPEHDLRRERGIAWIQLRRPQQIGRVAALQHAQ